MWYPLSFTLLLAPRFNPLLAHYAVPALAKWSKNMHNASLHWSTITTEAVSSTRMPSSQWIVTFHFLLKTHSSHNPPPPPPPFSYFSHFSYALYPINIIFVKSRLFDKKPLSCSQLMLHTVCSFRHASNEIQVEIEDWKLKIEPRRDWSAIDVSTLAILLFFSLSYKMFLIDLFYSWTWVYTCTVLLSQL